MLKVFKNNVMLFLKGFIYRIFIFAILTSVYMTAMIFNTAFAQGTLITNNANILIFLDTSGSMMWNQQQNYGTNGLYDPPESWAGSGASNVWAPGSNSVFSKIYNAKLAIGGVVSNFSSMNFAFASFQQNSNFGQTKYCVYSDDATFTNPSLSLGGTGTPDESGAYFNNNNYPFVNVYGTGQYCGHPTGEFQHRGVTYYFVSYDYKNYITNDPSFPGVSSLSPWYLYFPVQSGGTLGTGTTSVDVAQPFQSGTIVNSDIHNLLWTSEIYGSNSLNPADTPISGLKAGGGTPMSDSVADMYDFFENSITNSSSSSSANECLRYFSIIVTDGEANMGCDWNADDIPPNINQNTSCSNGNSNGIPSNQTPLEVYDIYNLGLSNTKNKKPIVTYMVGFGYSPTNPTSYLQEMADAGAGIDPNEYYTVSSGGATPTLNFAAKQGTTPDTLNIGSNPTTNGIIVGDTVSDNGDTSVTCEADNNYSMTYNSPSDCATVTSIYDNSGTSTTITLSNSLNTLSNGITVSGTVYLANNYSVLVQYLTNILKQIQSQTESFTSPVIHQVYGSNNDVYYANFTPSMPHRLWGEGNLFEFELNSSGELVGPNGVVAETCSNPNDTIATCPVGDIEVNTGDSIWSAGEQLTGNSNRNILTSELDSSNGQTSPLAFNTSESSALATLMGTTTANATDNVIPFVLNPGANLGSPYTDWKLGAIYHSDPVFIGSPSVFPYFSVPSYQAFANSNSGRTPVLVVGANDGMLHGFNANNGQEIFGYIPPDLLTELPQWYANSLSSSTPFFVDSTPSVSDVYFNNLFVVNGVLSSNSANSSNSAFINDSWHTILIGGERNGGMSYYALGLTNPSGSSYPDPLWDFSDAYSSSSNPDGNMGYTWSKPVISYVCLPYSTSTNGICANNPLNDPEYAKIYAGFTGGGYYTSTSTSAGNAVYALYASPNPVNISSTTTPNYAYEQVLWKFDSADDANMKYSIPSAVSPIFSPNGRIEAFYVGDLGGQMWAFDIPDYTMPYASSGKSNWTGCRIFASNSPLNIFYPPATTNDVSNNFWLFFGTGNRADLNNTTSANTNELIGIDTGQTTVTPVGTCPSGAPYSETNLYNATNTSETVTKTTTNSSGTSITTTNLSVISNVDVGWVIDLPHTNERVVSSPVVYDNIVYFTTYAPSSTSCGPGMGRLYAVYYTNGGSAIESNGTISEPITGSGSTSTSSTEQSINLGKGVPSAPVISGNTLIVTTSTGKVITEQVPGPVANITPTSWFGLP